MGLGRPQTRLLPFPTAERGSEAGSLSTQALGASFWTRGTDVVLAWPHSLYFAKRRPRNIQLACVGPGAPLSRRPGAPLSRRPALGAPTRDHLPFPRRTNPCLGSGRILEACQSRSGVRFREPKLCWASAGSPWASSERVHTQVRMGEVCVCAPANGRK